MFKIGDAVWVKARELKGVISYFEDGYIEVEFDNGSEASFDSEKDLEPYTNQVAMPKRREKNWSEMFAERYAPDFIAKDPPPEED